MEGFIGAAIGFALAIPVVKAFIEKVTLPLEEVGELLIAVANAVKDGKVTPDEVKQIIKEAEDVRALWRKV